MTTVVHIRKKRKLLYDPAKIRLARWDAGLRGIELARMTGLHKSTISLVESGKRQDVKTIARIAKALNLPMRAFHFNRRAA